jgi:hypothetical protein
MRFGLGSTATGPWPSESAGRHSSVRHCWRDPRQGSRPLGTRAPRTLSRSPLATNVEHGGLPPKAEARTALLALTDVGCSTPKAVELVSCSGGRGFRAILAHRIIVDLFGGVLERAVLPVVAGNGDYLGLRTECGVQSH